MKRHFEIPSLNIEALADIRPPDYLREAIAAQIGAIEAAIHRFRDCGVEIERFSIQTYQDEPLVMALCIDGIPKFTSRINQQ